MNSSKAAPNEPEPAVQKKKRRYLSAEKKFQIYLETQRPDQPVGEILRREGMFSTDLARIRQQVREGALLRLGAKPGTQGGAGQHGVVREAQSGPGRKGTRPGRAGGRTGHPAKKNEWGLVGPIANTWLPAATKQAIMMACLVAAGSQVSAIGPTNPHSFFFAGWPVRPPARPGRVPFLPGPL